MKIVHGFHNHISRTTNTILNVEEFVSSLDNVEFGGGLNQHQHVVARYIDREDRKIKKTFNCISYSPIIGLDGCGKSTLAVELHQCLAIDGQISRFSTTLLNQLVPFRSYFD